MSVVAAALRELMALGVEGDALVAAVERIERAALDERASSLREAVEIAARQADAALLERNVTKAAQRTRRWREKRHQASQTVTEPSPGVTSVTEPPETKVSPTPLSKTQTPSPPLVPPSPKLAERIWQLQPKLYRRATRPDVANALAPQLKRADPESIFLACQAYYARPECQEEGGKYAMNAARLLKADRWRDFLPVPEPPAEPATPAVLAGRIQHFRDTGQWNPAWGETPTEIAA